ncbi:MAG: cytochrome c biogenesis protein CcsA [Bacteroidetes bacterium]|nr:cytochrome c biogenesis protein CcsA [Bacteroidota bacterium]
MKRIPNKWFKILSILLVLYVLVYGLLIPLPSDVGMLDETIRNLFYHVPMWFGMMLIMLVAWIYSMLYLVKMNPNYDIYATELNNVGIIMGLAGLFTGMLWGFGTWGTPWTNDPKLNGVAVGMCMYGGYWLLQKSIHDNEKRARLIAVFNIFIFPLFIALIYVMPKLATFSIHPGSGDTVNFKTYNKTNNMQMVFYPAVIGWSLLFVWIAELRIRIKKLKLKKENEELFTQHIVTKHT